MEDQPGQRYSRDETDAQKLDRNYAELLQELRVAQTGVQILFAFLLTIAFQARFASLDTFQRDLYLATLVCAAVAAALLIAPVAAHRLLFRQHLKDELVTFTGRLAVGGLVFLTLAMLGAVLLIFDVVAGATAAAVVTSLMGVLVAVAWYVLPFRSRAARQEKEPAGG
jgi:hypothetical protein